MEAAKIYFIIFGLLTIAGGIVGYVKAGSAASIIAGAITGILLLVAAFLLPEHRVAKIRLRTWRRLVFVLFAAIFAAIVYRWISLERLQRLAPIEISGTPTPAPTPTA